MKLLRSAVAGFCFLLFAGGASAVPVTDCGDNVCFTYDNATEYGSAIVVGDAILFTPTGIVATASDGGSASTTRMLNLQVEILTEGYWLQDFYIMEAGDYTLTGDNASVDMDGIFKVSSDNTLTPLYSATENFDAGPLTVVGSNTEWSAGAMISLLDTPSWGSDTDVSIDITNTLVAETQELGELAQVQKKLGAVSIQVTAVPVPAAVWLFGSGLIGLVGFARRRAAS